FRLNGATCIIRSIGPMEVPRACPICCWSAPRTTTPHTTPTGRSASHPTDSPNGSHRSASTSNGVPADTTGTTVHPHHHHHPNNRTTTPRARGPATPQGRQPPHTRTPSTHPTGPESPGPPTRHHPHPRTTHRQTGQPPMWLHDRPTHRSRSETMP